MRIKIGSKQNTIDKLKRIAHPSRPLLPLEPKTFWGRLTKIFYVFARDTKVDGLYYLRKNATKGYAR